MRKPLSATILVLLIAACGPASPTPTPTLDVSAIQTQAAQDVIATMTAQAEEPSPPPTDAPTRTRCGVSDAIAWNDAGRYEGETIVVYGPVVDSHFASTSSGQPTFLNLGKPYPDPNRFTVLIWGDDRQAFIDAFGGPPEDIFLHRDVCVRGLIEYYKGSYEIILRVPGDIWFQ